MIEVILSPDLALNERREEAKKKRVNAIACFKIGDKVRAGDNGYPGILESVSDNGMASIRWDCGRLLCGVEVDRLQHVKD
jgi:hypothetical protein